MKPVRRVAVALAIALSGCCPNTVSGDPSAPIELELLFGNQAGHFGSLPDGGAVVLVRGGQGAQMVALSVRARNLNSCGASFEGSILYPGGPVATGPTGSTAPLQALSDGWLGIPDGDVGAGARLPIWSPSEGEWTAVGVVTDDKGRKVELQQPFTIACEPNDRYCRCYTLKLQDAGC